VTFSGEFSANTPTRHGADKMPRPENERQSSEGRGALFSEAISFFTSVKTTVTLLFILAAASVVGTVVPQPASLEHFQRTASPFVFRLIALLDLHDLFRSWWFLGLLALLAVNLLACLIQRAPGIVTEWCTSSSKPLFMFSETDSGSPTEIKATIISAVRPLLGCAPTEVNGWRPVVLTWVKHRIHLLGFPLVHCSIVVILAGGLIGIIQGFKGHVSIKEGESGSTFTVIRTGEVRTLPFEIAVDRFTLTRYPSGEPKEYRSDVRLIENGKEVLAGPIVVNAPLTYHGISLYQADYRPVGVRAVELGLTGPAEKQEDFTLEPYMDAVLPGTEITARLLSVDPGSTKRGMGAELRVSVPGEEPRTIQVFESDSAAEKVGPLFIRFKGIRPLYSTGLQIGYDPGANLVWVGCGLLIGGFFLTLFTNYRRLTIALEPENGHTLVKVSGNSRRLKAEFRTAVEDAVRGALRSNAGGTSPGKA